MSEISELRGKVGVYELVCTENGRRYIGQSNNMGRRLCEHFNNLKNGRHHNKAIQLDYDAYGKDAFRFNILYAGALSEEELNKFEEMEVLHAGGIESDSCYNVFTGGRETYRANAEFREAVSKRFKGTKKTEKQKQRAAEKAKAQWEDPEYRGLMISSAKAQWQSEAYREIMKKAHAGKPEACGHILTADIVREARKRYKEGAKANDLAEEYGVALSTMHSALRGTTWKYI